MGPRTILAENKISYKSTAGHKLLVTKDQFVVSLLRDHDNTNNVSIMLERVDQKGFAQVDVLNYREDKENHISVKSQSLHEISLDTIEDKVADEIFADKKFYSQSWSVDEAKGAVLLARIEKEVAKPPKFRTDTECKRHFIFFHTCGAGDDWGETPIESATFAFNAIGLGKLKSDTVTVIGSKVKWWSKLSFGFVS